MESNPSIMALEEAATDLIDAGCLAILYDEELAEHGALQLNVYSESLRASIATEEADANSKSPIARAKHVIHNVEAVTVDDQTVRFWADIAVGGLDPLGRRPLYIHQSVASDMESKFGEQSLDGGLAAVAAILQGDE